MHSQNLNLQGTLVQNFNQILARHSNLKNHIRNHRIILSKFLNFNKQNQKGSELKFLVTENAPPKKNRINIPKLIGLVSVLVSYEQNTLSSRFICALNREWQNGFRLFSI